jgi:predicted dehydrogenase
MKKNGSAIVVGVGHVGKKHALKLAKLFEKLYIIDPSENSLNWCHQNIDSDIMLFQSFHEVNFETIQNIDNSVGIISNWGVDHHDAFFNLTKNKINKIYIEKPFSHSLKKIDEISKFVEVNNVKLVSGFQLRHSALAEKIKNVCINSLGGNPVLVTVGGGANCIVTNGIHFLDLACSIFDQEPDNVFAKLGKNNINPRGNHLGFWDGFVSFGFNKSRLDISMSNESSMGLT